MSLPDLFLKTIGHALPDTFLLPLNCLGDGEKRKCAIGSLGSRGESLKLSLAEPPYDSGLLQRNSKRHYYKSNKLSSLNHCILKPVCDSSFSVYIANSPSFLVHINFSNLIGRRVS